MPKRSWKRRTESFRQMSELELQEFFNRAAPDLSIHQALLSWALGGPRGRADQVLRRTRNREERAELKEWKRKHVSPRMARWIYENLIPDSDLNLGDPWLKVRRTLLWLIAVHESAPPWKTCFFWREIEKAKSTRYGMHVVEAMGGLVGGLSDVPRFIALYEDQNACPEARGEALWGLAYLVRASNPAWLDATEDICLRALRNSRLPYAQAGACRLAAWTGRFAEEILALKDNQTFVIEGWGQTVGEYAHEAYEEYLEINGDQ